MRNAKRCVISSSFIVVVVGAAGCGPSLVIHDPFGAAPDPTRNSLHTYATHAQVPLQVSSTSPFTTVDGVTAKATGSVSLDPATTPKVSDAGVLSFAIVTGGAGGGAVQLFDKGGNVVDNADVTVVEPDGIAFAVTAPVSPGVDLPAVDITKVRIFAGGKAGFRTTLTHGTEELVGLQAVRATPADATLTTRNAAGCAQATCDAQRNALEVTVPAGTTAASDIAITAGTASATMHVIPSTDDDITDLVLDEKTPSSGKGGLVAHVVAGTEPVFGAPVTWQVDGTALANNDGTNETGDALQFDVAAPNPNPNLKPATHNVDAAVAGQAAAATVTGIAGSFQVSSITADCGAVPGSSATLAALAGALFLRRTTRGSRRSAATS